MNLRDVLEQDVTLIRAGRELVGLCPFHNEKTPSFYVNTDKGVYLCRSCGEGGDLVSYYVKKRGLSMREALRQAGKDLSGQDEEYARRKRAAREEILTRFYSWYHNKLQALNAVHEELFIAETAYRSICRAPGMWTADEAAYWSTYLGDLYGALDVALQDYERLCDEEDAWNTWKESAA